MDEKRQQDWLRYLKQNGLECTFKHSDGGRNYLCLQLITDPSRLLVTVEKKRAKFPINVCDFRAVEVALEHHVSSLQPGDVQALALRLSGTKLLVCKDPHDVSSSESLCDLTTYWRNYTTEHSITSRFFTQCPAIILEQSDFERIITMEPRFSVMTAMEF